MNHEVNVGRIPEGESDMMGIKEKKMNIPGIQSLCPKWEKVFHWHDLWESKTNWLPPCKLQEGGEDLEETNSWDKEWAQKASFFDEVYERENARLFLVYAYQAQATMFNWGEYMYCLYEYC